MAAKLTSGKLTGIKKKTPEKPIYKVNQPAAPPLSTPAAIPSNKGASTNMPSPVNVKVLQDKSKRTTGYEQTAGGVKQTLSPQQWNDLLNMKKISGYTSRDPAVAAAAQGEKDFYLREKMQQQLMEQKKIAEIENQINPKTKEYTGAPISTELPNVQPDIDITGNIIEEALTGGAKGALYAGGAAAIPAAVATLGSAGIAAPVAATGVGIAAGVGFIGGAIKGGFSAAKSNKAKVLTQAGQLTSDAEQGIKETINYAGKGLPEGEAIARFEQDVAYLSRARENLKAMDKKDHAYFEKNGLDEQIKVEREIANLDLYRAQLQMALANQDPNKADVYLLSQSQSAPQAETEVSND